MNSLKSGIAGLFGAVKSGAGYVKEQVIDDEKRAENVESLKGAVGSGVEVAKGGVAGIAVSAKEFAQSGALSARETVAPVGDVVYENVSAGAGFARRKSVAGASVVKEKLDEAGVSDAAWKAKESVVENVSWAGGKVNEKIEANPTLSNAKKATGEKLG